MCLFLCLVFPVFLPTSSPSLSLPPLVFLSLLISTFVKPTLQSLSLNLSLCVCLSEPAHLYHLSLRVSDIVGFSDFIFLNWCVGASTNVSARTSLVIRSLLSVCLSVSLSYCLSCTSFCRSLSPYLSISLPPSVPLSLLSRLALLKSQRGMEQLRKV